MTSAPPIMTNRMVRFDFFFLTFRFRPTFWSLAPAGFSPFLVLAGFSAVLVPPLAFAFPPPRAVAARSNWWPHLAHSMASSGSGSSSNRSRASHSGHRVSKAIASLRTDPRG